MDFITTNGDISRSMSVGVAEQYPLSRFSELKGKVRNDLLPVGGFT